MEGGGEFLQTMNINLDKLLTMYLGSPMWDALLAYAETGWR